MKTTINENDENVTMKQLIKSPLIIRILVILVLMLRIFTMHGGQRSQDNTTIFSSAESTYFGDHGFVADGSNTQQGIIGTVRTAPYGILNFTSAATIHTNTGDASQVDGYMRGPGAGRFHFLCW